MTGTLSIRLKAFTQWRSHSLFGFADFAIVEMHMLIKGATVHESHRKRWVGLPDKPQLNENGCAKRDERGKIVYLPVVLFEDRKTSERFSERAIEALLAVHPRAFDLEAGR